MLSDISKVMTLEPGDLVLTGTPKGVGPVQAGDIIRAGVKVDEKEINGGRIEVSVKDREGGFKFQET
jgi:acylpyruvate hydrolase